MASFLHHSILKRQTNFYGRPSQNKSKHQEVILLSQEGTELFFPSFLKKAEESLVRVCTIVNVLSQWQCSNAPLAQRRAKLLQFLSSHVPSASEATQDAADMQELSSEPLIQIMSWIVSEM